MEERTLKLVNRLGLHARAAAKFVHLASQHACSVELELDGEAADAKSILGILILAAPYGAEVTIRCSGDGEREALDQLCELVEQRFGEET